MIAPCIPWARLIFFKAVIVGANLLRGNFGSESNNDHGLSSHSDLKGAISFIKINSENRVLPFVSHHEPFPFCPFLLSSISDEYSMPVVYGSAAFCKL